MASDSYRVILYLFAPLWVLATVALGIGAIAQFHGIFSSSQVQMLSNVFLVILTGAYATSTFLLLYETARHREQDIQPAFALKVLVDGVEVRNVGSGPALQANIDIMLVDKGSGDEIDDSWSGIENIDVPTGDKVMIPYWQGWLEDINGEKTEVKFQAYYIDQYQEKHHAGPLLYQIPSLWDREMSSPHHSEEQSLQYISNELELLNKNVKRISENIQDDEVSEGK